MQKSQCKRATLSDSKLNWGHMEASCVIKIFFWPQFGFTGFARMWGDVHVEPKHDKRFAHFVYASFWIEFVHLRINKFFPSIATPANSLSCHRLWRHLWKQAKHRSGCDFHIGWRWGAHHGLSSCVKPLKWPKLSAEAASHPLVQPDESSFSCGYFHEMKSRVFYIIPQKVLLSPSGASDDNMNILVDSSDPVKSEVKAAVSCDITDSLLTTDPSKPPAVCVCVCLCDCVCAHAQSDENLGNWDTLELPGHIWTSGDFGSDVVKELFMHSVMIFGSSAQSFICSKCNLFLRGNLRGSFGVFTL